MRITNEYVNEGTSDVQYSSIDCYLTKNIVLKISNFNSEDSTCKMSIYDSLTDLEGLGATITRDDIISIIKELRKVVNQISEKEEM